MRFAGVFRLPGPAVLFLIISIWATSAAALTITSQPKNLTALINGSAAFSVTVSGQSPYHFQWMFNSAPISGATTNPLTLQKVQLSQAGTYSVAVTDAVTNVVSSNAVLTVNAVVVWGDYLDGETNVPLSATNAIALAAGDRHCIALLADGSVIGWGAQKAIPADITNVVSIGAGSTHSMVARADGTFRLLGSIITGVTNVPDSVTNVLSVAYGQGAQHALVLQRDGSVVDWGSFNPSLSNPPPTVIDIIGVSAGAFHSVALRPDGRVIAWGDNSFGQTNVPASATNIVAVSAGWYHTAALRANGTVVTWGSGPFGSIPPAPSSATNLVDVASMGNNVLALKRDGTLVDWSGTAPRSATNLASVAGGSHDGLILAGYGPPIIQGVPMTITVNAGTTNFLRCKATGALPLSYQWRFNGGDVQDATNAVMILTNVQPGQAGQPFTLFASNALGMATSAPITLVVLPLEALVLPTNLFSVVGANPTLATTIFGQGPFAYQWSFESSPIDWGTNATLTLTNAQLGDSGHYSVVVSNAFGSASANATVSITPTIVTNAPKTQTIFPGGTVTLSIGIQAVIPYSLQWLFNGVLIADATSNSLVLTNVQYDQTGLYGVVISNALEIVTNNATLTVVPVAAWGDRNQSTVPAVPTNLTAITAGENHGLGLTSDGFVVGWGDNSYGETTAPAGLSNVIAIGAGNRNSLALKADGTLAAWGLNYYGQGAAPAGLSNVVSIAAGDLHNLALRSDGTVVAWGNNDYSQTNVPAALSNVVAVAAGQYNSMALRADGTVVAWGQSNYGQSIVPPAASNVIQITTGGLDDLVLRGDGTIIGWGENFYGENNPPAGLSNVVAISGGYTHTVALTAGGTVTAWGDNSISETNIPAGLKNVLSIKANGFHTVALVGDHPPMVRVTVSSTAIISNAFVVTIPSESGHVYTFEYKNSLSDPVWTPLMLVAGTGRTLPMADPASSQLPQRFYRIRRW